MNTMVIAHRGASYLSDFENTLESFELAIQLGSDMVEFDVRETSDHVLVVFHDKTFGDSPISWQEYDKIEKEAYEKGFHVPTFEEVLDLCKGRIKMDIEVKEEGFEKKLVDILRKKCNYSDYSVKSFKDKVVFKVKSLDPHIRTGLLIGESRISLKKRINEIFPIRRLKKCRVDFVSPYYMLANAFFIKSMHKAGYQVYVWTVNDISLMKKCIRNNADAIISDKPDAVMAVRKKMEVL